MHDSLFIIFTICHFMSLCPWRVYYLLTTIPYCIVSHFIAAKTAVVGLHTSL